MGLVGAGHIARLRRRVGLRTLCKLVFKICRLATVLGERGNKRTIRIFGLLEAFVVRAIERPRVVRSLFDLLAAVRVNCRHLNRCGLGRAALHRHVCDPYPDHRYTCNDRHDFGILLESGMQLLSFRHGHSKSR
ncbi:hypothetical protein D9M68_723770 [compost metagenome]